MPVYKYQCAVCGRTTDSIVLPGKKEPKVCGYCSGALGRIPTKPATVYKGEGFTKGGE